MYPIDPLYIEQDAYGFAPSKQHEDDAAFDLRSTYSYRLLQGQTQLVDCGFRMEIPPGHVGLVCSRSGLASKHKVFVLNAPGVIDPGYRGNISVVLLSLRNEPFGIERGDRIAQLLILPNSNFKLVQSERPLSETARGSGGFGSTGLGETYVGGQSNTLNPVSSLEPVGDAPPVPGARESGSKLSAECRHLATSHHIGPYCTCAPPSCALGMNRRRVDL